jgi:hypothetical protein
MFIEIVTFLETQLFYYQTCETYLQIENAINIWLLMNEQRLGEK